MTKSTTAQEMLSKFTQSEVAHFLEHPELYRVTMDDMGKAIEAIAPEMSQTFAVKLNTWLHSMLDDLAEPEATE